MDSNVTRIRNIVRQGGKVYSFVTRLNYCTYLALDSSIHCNNRHNAPPTQKEPHQKMILQRCNQQAAEIHKILHEESLLNTTTTL